MDIPAGAELTYDYRFAGEARLPCNCGARSCRGVVNEPHALVRTCGDGGIVAQAWPRTLCACFCEALTAASRVLSHMAHTSSRQGCAAPMLRQRLVTPPVIIRKRDRSAPCRPQAGGDGVLRLPASMLRPVRPSDLWHDDGSV